MKKLLGFSVLVAVLLLSACGGSEEVVCKISILGEGVIYTAMSEDGVVTSLTREMRIDVSGFDAMRIKEIEEEEGGMLEGNYVVSYEIDTEIAEYLEDFVSTMELVGGVCD